MNTLLKHIKELGVILGFIEAQPKQKLTLLQEVVVEGRHVRTIVELICPPGDGSCRYIEMLTSQWGVKETDLKWLVDPGVGGHPDIKTAVFYDSRPLAFWRQEAYKADILIGARSSEIWADPITRSVITIDQVED